MFKLLEGNQSNDAREEKWNHPANTSFCRLSHSNWTRPFAHAAGLWATAPRSSLSLPGIGKSSVEINRKMHGCGCSSCPVSVNEFFLSTFAHGRWDTDQKTNQLPLPVTPPSPISLTTATSATQWRTVNRSAWNSVASRCGLRRPRGPAAKTPGGQEDQGPTALLPTPANNHHQHPSRV